MDKILPEWQKQTIEQLHLTLQNLNATMMSFQYKTDYKNAEIYRNMYENCKNYILDRNINQTQQRYKNQINQTNILRLKQLNNCRKQWSEKLKQYNSECERLFQQLAIKHQHQNQATQMQMQAQLSTVVKQSNQLINLRKMQAHAANQKSFVQAHSIQQKVKKLYQTQRIAWMQGRQKTIQQALKNVKNKQNNQIQGIDRKIKLTLQDFAKQKYLQQLNINNRYDNYVKQLKAKFQRDILSLHGQLKNLGGRSPAKKRNKLGNCQQNQEKIPVDVD